MSRCALRAAVQALAQARLEDAAPHRPARVQRRGGILEHDLHAVAAGFGGAVMGFGELHAIQAYGP
jgi:hypothetical protein